MEPTVTTFHLEQLAARLAWSRLLPGLVLLAVGISQPVATVNREDDDGDHALSLTGVVGQHDEFDHGTIAATFSVLVLVSALGLAAWSLSAIANRTEVSRRVTIGLSVLVLVLVVFMVVTVGSARPTAVEGADLSVSPQGTIPLLLGGIAVWAAASRAKSPSRLFHR